MFYQQSYWHLYSKGFPTLKNLCVTNPATRERGFRTQSLTIACTIYVSHIFSYIDMHVPPKSHAIKTFKAQFSVPLQVYNTCSIR